MEALNAVGLSSLSVLSERTKPRKDATQFKNQTFFPNSKNRWEMSAVTRTLHGGLALLNFLNSGIAKALEQSASSTVSDFDLTNFAVENPVIVGGGFTLLAAPLLVSQLLGKPKAWGVESARNAYAKLRDDANARLLDIRTPGDVREAGSPNISGLKKKPVAVAYNGGDKPGFLKKLSSKFKEPENTTLFILDKFDGNSELVSELVTVNGFKAAYAIKDGAEGSRGWKETGLPWITPKKGLNLDLGDLKETIDAAPLALGVAAAGLGFLAFREIDVLLQLIGSAALVQFVSQKFLFAEDRKQTVQQFEKFLDTKVVPKELVGDLQHIGRALLPFSATSKAVPAPADIDPSSPSDGTVQKYESTSESNGAPSQSKAAPEPTLQVNSIPKAAAAAVQQESINPVLHQPLSPYPNYPNYKPPSSPIPSQP